MRLLVTGGTGFIGRAVCRAALAAGHEVRALGRRGRPAEGDAWVDRVRWIAADVHTVDSWRDALDGCDAVVHCVGILAEKPAAGITFARMNGDALIAAGGAAEAAGVGAVVFLSASDTPPGVSREYLRHKRRAETWLLARPSLRGVVLRPGFVHGAERPVSVPVALAMRAGLLLPFLPDRLRASRPLPVEVVARAAVRAAADAGTRGILDADAIERLGA